MRHFALTAGLAATSASMTRTINFVNDCGYTVWPGMWPPQPGNPGGWQMDIHGDRRSYNVPHDWVGRIWGRASCTYNGNALECLDGACDGGEDCEGPGGRATLAQFTLNPNGVDTYSVSVVDGFNVPFRIENDKGCKVPGCAYDLLENCPLDQREYDKHGYVIFCRQCPAGGLRGGFRPDGCDSHYFDHCPNANARPDDNRGSAQCEDDATYTVRFCPPQDHN